MGFNELGPVNATEMFVMYCMLLGSSIINAQIFGNIAVTVQVMQSDGVQEQMALDGDYNVMTFMEISDEDQDKIRDFLSYVRVTREHQEDFD